MYAPCAARNFSSLDALKDHYDSTHGAVETSDSDIETIALPINNEDIQSRNAGMVHCSIYCMTY
jgi:hypothetical protein